MQSFDPSKENSFEYYSNYRVDTGSLHNSDVYCGDQKPLNKNTLRRPWGDLQTNQSYNRHIALHEQYTNDEHDDDDVLVKTSSNGFADHVNPYCKQTGYKRDDINACTDHQMSVVNNLSDLNLPTEHNLFDKTWNETFQFVCQRQKWSVRKQDEYLKVFIDLRLTERQIMCLYGNQKVHKNKSKIKRIYRDWCNYWWPDKE